MRILAALSLFTLLEIFSPTTHATGLPLVISATVDYTHGSLTVTGQNFGSNPTVTLDALTFPTQASGSSQIVANFPSDKAPSSFTPGTYFLTVRFKNQFPAIFAVDIGANGAPGPAGPAGAPGAPGATGVPGPAGPAGPQGLSGPIGPVGATGRAGAAGAQGLQGVAGPIGPQGLQGAAGATGAVGPQGLQGPAGATGPQGSQGLQGPKGDKGDPGSSSGGLVCTTVPSVFLVTAANGTQTCQPRFTDNGDLTVTDNQTGLMWEKKFDGSIPIICSVGDLSCPPDAHHEVHNTYSWSAASPSPDPTGTLYSDFLQQLNGLNNAGGTSCFAGHCDWRIPSIGELRSILPGSYPYCTFPCRPPDPPFGPTQASKYWSSSSVASESYRAWFVDFSDSGFVNNFDKSVATYARAVRSDR